MAKDSVKSVGELDALPDGMRIGGCIKPTGRVVEFDKVDGEWVLLGVNSWVSDEIRAMLYKIKQHNEVIGGAQRPGETTAEWSARVLASAEEG